MDYRLHQGWIQLRTIPDRFYKCNQVSTLEHTDFVSKALQGLEDNCCIVQVPECPYIWSP